MAVFGVKWPYMELSDKKMAVLYAISEEAESCTLTEILKKLGSEYKARSVRRWLHNLAQEGIIEKVGKKKATRYRVLVKSERTIETVRSTFSFESEKILQQVSRPLYERTPVSYNDQWFQDYQPNQTFYLTEQARRQLHGSGKRTFQNDPAGTYAHQIFNRLLIDLSYNSSRLEGNTYSLLDTEKLLLRGEGVEGKLHEEKVMILNHKEAIRFLVDSALKLGVNEETVLTIHFLLSEGLVEPNESGKVRSYAVRVGGSAYIPFDKRLDLEIRLTRLIKTAAQIQDPYEQSFFLLVHLSYLQAFTDVNKRTARLCANIPLIQQNQVPLSFNDVEREDYTSAMMAVYEMQEVGPLGDLYVFSYLRTCALYDSTVKAMGFDEVRIRYRQQRRNLVLYIVTQYLVGESLQTYIQVEIKMLIQTSDQKAFLEDIQEDLDLLDEIRLVGLGVTRAQYYLWKEKKTKISDC